MTVGRLLKGPENLFPQLASYYEQRDPTRTQDLLSKLEQFGCLNGEIFIFMFLSGLFSLILSGWGSVGTR